MDAAIDHYQGKNGKSRESVRKRTKRKRSNMKLQEFCESTTLHGVNKIVEDTPYTARRIFWVFIVLGGLLLFTLQLIQNIRLYLEYPVTVNVKINYNDTLTFPAVTICNQNDFRTTAASSMNRYRLIRDYYNNLYENGINLTEYQAQNITLDDIYSLAAHTKEDLIVDCEWIGQKCDIGEDIALTVTDYGYCYTFNSGKNQTQTRNLTNTGADLGLRLILNLEQYEYMRGPNSGAGIKVLLHDATEVPLVRDLGQAIPPGSHAFVGVQILQINNLPHPHGICNDSAKLHFYDHYSISACMLERRESYVMDLCHCRDVYMPTDHAGYPPVCSLEQYQSCYMDALAVFNQQTDHAHCPLPCHRTMYDATITYAAISNFDTHLFLRSKNINHLREKYLMARETTQRVDDALRHEDKRLFAEFNRTYNVLTEKVFLYYKTTVDKISSEVMLMMDEVTPRKQFHMRWGLEKLLYTVEHNFIRGWDVMAERTFSLITSYYQDTMNYIIYALPLIASTSTSGLRLSYFVEAEARLLQHRSLAVRALDNMTEVYNAYKNSTAILRFKVSPKKRYDLAYITPNILKHDDDNIDVHVERARQRLIVFIERLDEMSDYVKTAIVNGTVNMTEVMHTKTDLEYRARSYNLYRFKIKTRVVDVSRDICEGLIDAFIKTYDSLIYKANEINSFFENTKDALAAGGQQWGLILKLRDDMLLYLDNETITKASLAKFGTSDEVTQNINYLRAFFSDLRSRFASISSLLMQLEIALSHVWQSLLSEKALYPFYSQLNSDVNEIQTDHDALYLLKIIRFMVNEAHGWDYSIEEVETMKDQLHKLTNADFVTMNHTRIFADIEQKFTALQFKTSAEHSLSDEGAFIKAFGHVHEMLNTYEQFNKIDSNFFRENFIEVDVFMKELSYEEVDQQIAYDQTALWSDIGGSLGLFIGASVITLLELFDFLLFSVIRCSTNRQKL